MPAVETGYNERAWRVDLVGEINRIADARKGVIARATGDRTLTTGRGAYFPDVLLHGLAGLAAILQGWELKFPDTAVTDVELLANARMKAEALGLTSFLVWNVETATLYARNDADAWLPIQSWSAGGVYRARHDVEAHPETWRTLLGTILDALEGYFASGRLRPVAMRQILETGRLFGPLLDGRQDLEAELKLQYAKDRQFADRVDAWWASNRRTYPGKPDKWDPLAERVLVNWGIRVVFVSLLRGACAASHRGIEQVAASPSAVAAEAALADVVRECDFGSILGPTLASGLLSDRVWARVTQLAEFVRDRPASDVGADALQEYFLAVVTGSRRNLSGQFATPPALADLLVRLCIEDATGHFLDPFCGTGTFLQAAIRYKRERQVGSAEAMATTWGCDRFDVATQLSALALANPERMNDLVRVFQHDTFQLLPGQAVSLGDPRTGAPVQVPLPRFSSLASNPPFLPREDIARANPSALAVNDWIGQALGSDARLPQKSDLYAYAPFALWPHLQAGARAGFILSNAWLATDWGAKFRALLERFFQVELVVISGAGRWFQNADVVTTLLVLRRRPAAIEPGGEERARFVVLDRPLSELEPEDARRNLVARLQGDAESGDGITTRTNTRHERAALEALGMQWSAFFADIEWLPGLAEDLVPLGRLAVIARGERPDSKEFFHPRDPGTIEPGYLRPALMSSRSIAGYVAPSDGWMFCCDQTEEDLRRLGHHGALAWIERNRELRGRTGKLLRELRGRGTRPWYSYLPKAEAEFVTSLNPGPRLFISRLAEPMVVNQRLICIRARGATQDRALLHALLNSSLSMFYLEAIGFGRGLGALDLDMTGVRENFRILRPDAMDAAAAARIVAAFAPIRARAAMTVEDEFKQEDRQGFERALWTAVGRPELERPVRDALLALHRIRAAARPA